jgi:predicted CopG family antitoxin
VAVKYAHTQIYTEMATKNIAISEEAYERLRMLKKEGESFTDVINRIAGGTGLGALVGVLSDEAAGEVEARVSELRRASAARVKRAQEMVKGR